MRKVDLSALEVLKAVVDEGGVAKAAARLHRVPSNVTTRVKQLEARLGTALFHRRRGRLVLTPEGQVLLGYADRRRVVDDATRKLTFLENGYVSTVLVDGFVRAVWKLTVQRKAATLAVEPLAPLSADDRAALVEEGERLLRFMAPQATSQTVQLLGEG